MESWKVELDEGIAVVQYSGSPEALSFAAMTELAELLEGFANSASDVSVVVLTGPSEQYLPDADREELKQVAEPEWNVTGDPLAWHRVVAALSSLSQPTVAAIDGPAVGGGCLIALACTLRIASERATVGPVEFDMGVAGTESSSNLVRLAGPAVAAELLLTGRELTASDAKQVGLLNDVFPTSGFGGQVRDWCHRITENPPSLLLAIKRTIAQDTGVCRAEAQPLGEVFGMRSPGCGCQH